MQDEILEPNEIVPSEDNEQWKAEIAAQAMMSGLAEIDTDIHVDLDRATKIPFSSLTAFGAAFASLPEAFRTVTQTVEMSGEGLFRVTDAAGNALNANVLQAFNDGSGLLGSFRDMAGQLHQARLHEVASQTANVTTVIPFDPTSLFIAAALMEINKKLDTIQETQQEMFTYIKNKDKAKLRGDLQALTDILNDLRFNWDDQGYIQAKWDLVQTIKNDSYQAIIQHRAEIKGRLQKGKFIHLDKDVGDKVNAVRSELEEYRLSVYLYGFSSFLEVMLQRNFEETYLENVAERIRDYSVDYRELYTQAYNLIEAEADSSIRAVALGSLSKATGFLSKAVEKTPIGDHTQIDEALGGASEGIGGFSENVKNGMLGKLIDASSSDVLPFIENIQTVSRLYNDPIMLMADEESVYVLPADAIDSEALEIYC